MDELKYRNMDEYYKSITAIEILDRFHLLLTKRILFPDKFTEEEATELIYILENYKEDMQTFGEVLRNSGHDVELIKDFDWDSVLDGVKRKFPRKD